MKKRQSFNKAFKAKVVLEALREELTLQEIAKKYDVHPNQISLWKKQAIESLPEIFERPNKKTEGEKQPDDQYDEVLKTLGAMKIENEFLKKSTSNCTGPIRSDRKGSRQDEYCMAMPSVRSQSKRCVLREGACYPGARFGCA